jgi:hypothetical protein
LEQELNEEKLPTVQSTAQSCVLQALVSLACAHAEPPHSGCDCERERLMLPEPHDFVQVLQGSHVAAMQLTGQQTVLHARVSALCGQASPPSAGSVVARERLWLPPSHDTGHVLHADHDS